MKFYKVIKENFLWEVGAILKLNDGGYYPVDDIYKKHEKDNEYISSEIVEASPEYFQRVYPVNLLSRTVYKIKEEAKEILSKEYSDK